LSFDHRVLDGGAAGRLLARVSSLLQTPEKLKYHVLYDFRRSLFHGWRRLYGFETGGNHQG